MSLRFWEVVFSHYQNIANISGIKKGFSTRFPIPDPDAAIPDPKNMQKPRYICIHIWNTLV